MMSVAEAAAGMAGPDLGSRGGHVSDLTTKSQKQHVSKVAEHGHERC